MNNCCCIYEDEEAAPEFSSQRLQRARKPHTCGECQETIPIGALYESFRGKWHGRFNTHQTCARCANIRDEYFTCGWYFTRLVEDFLGCFGFDYRDGLPADFAPCRGKAKEQTP